MTSILFIVFLPLAASILAGFSNKSFGTFFPKAVTTVALFVACALSWPVFIHYLGGGEKVPQGLKHGGGVGLGVCRGSGRARALPVAMGVCHDGKMVQCGLTSKRRKGGDNG